ncbi:MAG: archaetidylserine decarboxylase [Pseudomonadales bacterium]
MMQKLFIVLQYLIPQHLLSRAAGWLANTEIPWIKNPFIEFFIRQYSVNMSEAADPEARNYPNFNAFFTRALRDDARTVAEDTKAIASPADGSISQLGRIENGRIFQAKGQSYTVQELLGGDNALAEQFIDGCFSTIYLSPKDYHRVHMPVSGTLQQMIYVPGDLFSVNKATAENVPRLFARNERLVAIFETAAGPMAMVLVGAMIVAAIETVWAGQVTPTPKTVNTTRYNEAVTIALNKGEEMGRFKLGSTVVLLFPKDRVKWDEALAAGSPLMMGQEIAQLI